MLVKQCFFCQGCWQQGNVPLVFAMSLVATQHVFSDWNRQPDTEEDVSGGSQFSRHCFTKGCLHPKVLAP